MRVIRLFLGRQLPLDVVQFRAPALSVRWYCSCFVLSLCRRYRVSSVKGTDQNDKCSGRRSDGAGHTLRLISNKSIGGIDEFS